MRVVGSRAQAGGLDRLHHGPKALARHQWRGGLDHGIAAGGQTLVQQSVEGLGVELADGEIGGVGKVHHDDVKNRPLVLQPLKGIGVDDAHFWAAQGVVIEPPQGLVRSK